MSRQGSRPLLALGPWPTPELTLHLSSFPSAPRQQNCPTTPRSPSPEALARPPGDRSPTMVAGDSPVTKPPAQTQDSTSDAESGDLRRRVLPLWAVYSTAIAVVAPTGSLAFGMAGVSSAAGNATWLSFAIITVGILGVAYCISFTARRFSSAGGLYGFASRVAGNGAGYVQGVPQLMTAL